MSVLVKIYIIFSLIIPCIVGQTTGSGSSTFITENTESSTTGSTEQTDITITGSSTFITENTESSTTGSTEATDTTITGSSTFITENTETSTTGSTEETDTTITGSTFLTENFGISTVSSTEDTGATSEDTEYLTNDVFSITPTKQYLTKRSLGWRDNIETDLITDRPISDPYDTYVSPCKVPGPVRNVFSNNSGDYMYIWWSDSESTQIKNCFYNYRFEVQHNGNTVFTSLTKDPAITIYKPDYCVKHTYIISAENSKGIAVPEFVTYDETKVNDPPKHAGNEYGDKYVITKWTIGENKCSPDKFYVKCSSPTEHSDIVTEGFKLHDMFTAYLFDLVPNTNYSCCGIFENVKGNSSCGYTTNIQIEAEAFSNLAREETTTAFEENNLPTTTTPITSTTTTTVSENPESSSSTPQETNTPTEDDTTSDSTSTTTTSPYTPTEDDTTSDSTTTTTTTTISPCEGDINGENLNIKITPTNTTLSVSWNSPISICDFTYIITLNDKPYNTTTNLTINIDGLDPCTYYKVTVEVYYEKVLKGTDSEVGSTLPATGEYAQVQHLDIKAKPSELHVTWDKPRYNCDKYDYTISWGTNTEKPLENNNNNYIIKDLNPCTAYDVSVATVLDGNTNTIAQVSNLTSTSPAIPGPVKDLNINDKNEDYINITWSQPTENTNCVDNYRYEVQYNGKPVFTSLTKDTYIIVEEPEKCVKHTYIVYANSSIGNSTSENVSYDKTKVNNKPQYVGKEFRDNFVITKWKTGKQDCNPDNFYVKCSSPTVQAIKGFKSDDMFIAHLYDLLPYTNYTCCGIFENIKGNSSCGDAHILTEAKEPDSPTNLTVTVIEENILDINWEEPSSWNGESELYNITVEYLQSMYHVPDGCAIPMDKFVFLVNSTDTVFQTHPLEYSTDYKISVAAKSSGGWGNVTETTITTLSGIPEPVRGLKCFLNINNGYNYNASVTMNWKPPCKWNGPLGYFEIELCKHREDTAKLTSCTNHNSIITIKPDYERVISSLEAEYDYELKISVHNDNDDMHSNVENCAFTTPAGVPNKPTGENIFKVNDKTIATTTAEVFINRETFSSDMGIIRHYAIIVAERGCEEDPKDGIFDPKNWPMVSSNCNFQGTIKAYQATPNNWNPFINKDAQDKNFTLGVNLSCDNTDVICNRPLNPNTNYTVKIRGFTNYGYSDTTFVYFTTASVVEESGVNVGMIVGIIIGILVIAFIIAGALFYNNGRILLKNWPRMDSESQISPTPPPVPIKKFDSHYRKMSENSGKIRSEFQLLSTISSDVTLSTKTASLPDNKKKNRYVNILPYDETRVILNVTNSSSSDYINASYIQGYSGNIEYIAAQGPTEATCPAFWQMVLEQNVRIIVMLTQCVENGKDKCYKYFPTVVEEYDLNNDIKIECVEEQLFTVYNRRTFKVVKNNVAKRIIHLQFNLWPDFDVPDDVSKMIEFYEIVKEIKMKKPSAILVHCSAGVGRTGTLIAIDILTQNIRDKRKVDIFGTVLNLRKQRMMMVQSERQYEFLFKCVHYIITRNGNTSNEHISESNM